MMSYTLWTQERRGRSTCKSKISEYTLLHTHNHVDKNNIMSIIELFWLKLTRNMAILMCFVIEYKKGQNKLASYARGIILYCIFIFPKCLKDVILEFIIILGDNCIVMKICFHQLVIWWSEIWVYWQHISWASKQIFSTIKSAIDACKSSNTLWLSQL